MQHDYSSPLEEALAVANGGGFIVPCQGGDTLLATQSGFNTSVCSEGSCIIASNLHNSAEVLPNLIVQLARLAHILGPANILVSVYESGSTDATRQWLDLLRGVLSALSVRHVITSKGSLIRRRDQDRIAFLASVRQAAVDQAAAACDSYRAAASGSSAGGAGTCTASRLVFVNDVFFNAADVVRLLQYGGGAGGGGYDVACGMDFEPILADLPLARQRDAMSAHLQRTWGLAEATATWLSSWPLAFRYWKKAYRRAPSLLRALPLLFYDIWVARDLTGGRLYRAAPYAAHAATAKRLRAGLPVDMYCCWNGLVALAAEPLLPGRGASGAASVRFRAGDVAAGECAASECSLLCDDLRRLGRGAAVMDPGVLVAYRRVAAERLFADSEGAGRGGGRGGGGADDYTGIELEDGEGWGVELLAELAAWRRQHVSADMPHTVECCGLRPGSEGVDFEHGCARVAAPHAGPAP
ncbi:hypothetical protein HYH02_001624 [Chlamydomonas schloesseri]|uniref:Uncharacterized protein n=1 Tax=Chlamydomonas schloesseri TaxID=2026947 RepID=A0A835WTE7_9CHLO|nr:hypothetical protein HYH02_001624 [Chlamydomonas schloesseri]|eukprot:KAG2453400.1 hypothetical protein HYH02_001624 [Chlamydomonas schloesseri]